MIANLPKWHYPFDLGALMQHLLSCTALLALILLSLTACQPVSVLNTVSPDGDTHAVTGLAYGEHDRQRLDIYLPTPDQQRQHILVFFYGGAWDQGHKDEFEFVGRTFARAGYITVIPNYRLYPEVEFPAFMHDKAAAVGALPELLRQLQGDYPERFSATCPRPEHLIFSGHSAGAHGAALLLADPEYLTQQNVDPAGVRALLALSGPHDLPLEHERVKEKFTQVSGNEANPLKLAHAEWPPTLLLHGESDTIAAPFHSERLSERLSELGVPNTLKTYPRTRHADLLASLAPPLRLLSPAYDDIGDFLAEQQLDGWCE